jgi:hypothetical protein
MKLAEQHGHTTIVLKKNKAVLGSIPSSIRPGQFAIPLVLSVSAGWTRILWGRLRSTHSERKKKALLKLFREHMYLHSWFRTPAFSPGFKNFVRNCPADFLWRQSEVR